LERTAATGVTSAQRARLLAAAAKTVILAAPEALARGQPAPEAVLAVLVAQPARTTAAAAGPPVTAGPAAPVPTAQDLTLVLLAQVAVAVVAGTAVAAAALAFWAKGRVAREVPQGCLAMAGHPVPMGQHQTEARTEAVRRIRPPTRQRVVVQCGLSGPAIFANSHQQEQQTNKDHSWNTHS